MSQAEIAAPIGSVPARWAGLTTVQLGWLACSASLPYLLARLHLPLPLLLLASLPWVAAGLCLAVCRCEGRRLDAWIADWIAFRFQPKSLQHPETAPTALAARAYVSVDRGWAGARVTIPQPR